MHIIKNILDFIKFSQIGIGNNKKARIAILNIWRKPQIVMVGVAVNFELPTSVKTESGEPD